MHRSNSVIPVCLEFSDIDGADAVGLDGVDVDYETILWGWVSSED